MDLCYDVVVVGGGTAGVIAALQSAKAGVKTLLIEKTEMLGGTITNARVFAPGLFHAWGKQIIGGLGWELICKCVEENGDSLPDFTEWNIKQHWTAQIGINVFLYALLCDEALKNAGCDVLVTADVKHHLFLAAAQIDFALIDAGHFPTEDTVIEPLMQLLSKEFPSVNFITDHNSPIKVCINI